MEKENDRRKMIDLSKLGEYDWGWIVMWNNSGDG